jgi:hypothetical protein
VRGGRGRHAAPLVKGHLKEAPTDRQLRADAADVIAGMGRHWGWLLAFGIVTLLAGLLTWPRRTIVISLRTEE